MGCLCYMVILPKCYSCHSTHPFHRNSSATTLTFFLCENKHKVSLFFDRINCWYNWCNFIFKLLFIVKIFKEIDVTVLLFSFTDASTDTFGHINSGSDFDWTPAIWYSSSRTQSHKNIHTPTHTFITFSPM